MIKLNKHQKAVLFRLARKPQGAANVLPYTAEFDRLCLAFWETTREPISARDIHRALIGLRKELGLPPKPRKRADFELDEHDKATIRELYVVQGKVADKLAYTHEFEVMWAGYYVRAHSKLDRALFFAL